MYNFKSKLKTSIGTYFILITFGICLFLGLSNLSSVSAVFTTFFSAASPLFIGIGIAFLLNFPMKFFENIVLKNTKISTGAKRALSITLSLISLFLIIYAISVFVFPQLKDSVTNLAGSIPTYLKKLETLTYSLLDKFQVSPEVLATINAEFSKLLTMFTNFLTTAVPYIFNITFGIANSTINFFIAFVMSIYLLSSKEKIIGGTKKLLFASIDFDIATLIVRIAKLSNYTFSRFIGGQLIESVIVGFLCLAGTLFLRMDYAILISVIIGITNIVPIVGPFIGTIPCAIILLTISPVKALIFVIFIVCMQQFESNVIYPRVVGSSIGLTAIWIMTAILIGGKYFGILGIILGVPAFAVVYTLLREWTYGRLKKKKIDIKTIEKPFELSEQLEMNFDTKN